MPEPQPTRFLLHKVHACGVSAGGDSYADVLLIHPQGGTYKARVFVSMFFDLNELHAYEGKEVSVQLTPIGLQITPIAEQATPAPEPSATPGWHHDWASKVSVADSDSPFSPPEPVAEESTLIQGCSTTRTLQEVATTVACLARDLSLPTIIWVHIPGRQNSHPQDCTVAPRSTASLRSGGFAP